MTNKMNDAQKEAVAEANAHLTNAGLPSYNEVLNLLFKAQYLGLTFDIGNAYIRREYINQQTALVTEIDRIPN